ncbi:MAG: polyhydroxyalkanoate synthesis repressor PhaR [Alphaproteobacteria bacterium]|nr:polyhydroxyalkanoate synthesis repressor PhaR [Alphaproteobacteria bacterium]
MNTETAKSEQRIVIKKYANRRLYNTATSSYVTLDHLCQMVKDGTDFVVFDAKSGEDITHSVLTQIIVEEENKGQNLLPIGFLRQLISFYGDNLQTFLPRYLEMSMGQFTHNQGQMREYLKEAFGGLFPFPHVEAMVKDNAAMFQRAMTMFYPFGNPAQGGEPGSAKAGDPLGELRNRINELQQQVEALAKRPGS